VLVVAVGTAVTDVAGIAASVGAAAERCAGPSGAKPVLRVTIGPVGDGAPGPVTAFDSIDGAVSALTHAVHYADWRAGRAVTSDPRSAVPPLPAGQPLLAGSPSRSVSRWLAYDEVRSLLGEFGIVPGSGAVAGSDREAVAVAQQLGFPVVVKTAVPTIVHKSDNSLVHTGITTAAGVRGAVRSIQDVVGPGTPVLVQQAASGVEIAVGMFQDERFGPLVMVASGGVAADLWDDQVFLLPPLDAEEVRAALGRLRTWPLLVGFRGSPAVDVDPLVALVRKVGDLAVARPEVCELDLNPVMVSTDGVSCVDAKIRVADRLQAEA
jgi:acyl-CoA synthetase (NDP forming)